MLKVGIGLNTGIFPVVAMVMALWPGILPAASASSKGGFVHGTVRDSFGKSGIRRTDLSAWVEAGLTTQTVKREIYVQPSAREEWSEFL